MNEKLQIFLSNKAALQMPLSGAVRDSKFR
jgi:hypothetical protein